MQPEFYPKAERIEQELIHEIAAARHGVPGTPFMTTRALMEYKKIALKTAHRILGRLCAGDYLEVRGRRYYLKGAAAAASRPLVGLLLSRLDTPYFSNLAANLEELTRAMGAELSIAVSNYDEELERRQLQCFLDRKVSGIFATPWGIENNAQFYAALNVPVVLIGRKIDSVPLDSVLIDNFKAATSAAAHLIANNCDTFAYVGMDSLKNDRRLAGFSFGLRGAGRELKPENIIAGDSPEITAAAVNALLRRAVNGRLGVFCYHDLFAAKLITQCHELKIAVPRQVAIVGFDNLPVSAAIYPALTSVAYPLHDMARIACEVLFARINSPHDSAVHGIDRYLDTQLIIRNTTFKEME